MAGRNKLPENEKKTQFSLYFVGANKVTPEQKKEIVLLINAYLKVQNKISKTFLNGKSKTKS